MKQRPWYYEGLAFQCTGCGDCCTGDPGYVWVTAAEIEALARALRMGVAAFEAAYVRQVDGRKSLVELNGGDCALFDGRTRKCKVYGDRPRQCRTWPFWHSNIRTEADWAYTCRVCPGAGRGPVVPLEAIRSLAFSTRE